MVTTTKHIPQVKAGREVLYFDIPEKTGIVSIIGADTDPDANIAEHPSDAGKTVYGFSQEKVFGVSLKPISEHETGNQIIASPDPVRPAGPLHRSADGLGEMHVPNPQSQQTFVQKEILRRPPACFVN